MKAKTMKKALSLFLAVLMIALAIPFTLLTVSAASTSYDSANDGDVLYEVNFNGDSTYNPIDGRGSWYKTNATPSNDGKSVTVQYTTDKRDGATVTLNRARFCSEAMTAFPVNGRSYTIEFTIDSKADVGFMLDGNTGFVINPSLNRTSIGQSDWRSALADYEVYDGTGNSKQTYAIELECSNTLTGVKYYPTVYKLYVQQGDGTWKLIREVGGNVTVGGSNNGKEMASIFEWEYYSANENYAYFYLSINRYGADENNFDANDNPVTSTVSDVTIKKGINFIEKYVEGAEEQEKEPLYTVNFNGDSTYNPIDGRDNWYKTNATPSDDGKSVTVEYTTEEGTGDTFDKQRARFCSTAMTAFPVNGRSYTVEFTIDSKADVGFMLDGNTGFVINPSLNRTSIGQTDWRSALADYEVYDGTGESKQTYAIELECSNTLKNGKYDPVVYKLYVQQENGTWKLIRELPYSKAEKFEWEDGYAYFYLSINRYGADENNFDADGNPVKSTVSDVKIYDSIGFLPAFGLVSGAQVRMDEPTGLRFTGVLGKHYVDGLRKTYGEEDVTIGMLITPTDYLDGIEFTKEALDNSAALANYEYKYLEIDATTILTEGTNYKVNCAIVNIQEANYSREFSAILYIKITDGDTVSYSYSSYNAEYNSRSVAYVASVALSDMKEEQGGDYQNTVTDVYGKTMYSPYDDDQRTLLESFSSAVTSFTVMTYNINIEANNSENILDTVKNAAPDIVGFQEDSENWKDILPELKNSGYNNVGGESNNDEYLDIYYNSEKFTEVTDGALYYKDLKNTYSNVPLNGADLSLDDDGLFSDYKGRYLRYVVLKDASGTQILVVNTHLHRGDNSAEDRLLREYQARLLKAWLDAMAAQYPNQVVLGDINDGPSENSIIELTSDGALSQARRSAFLKVDVGGTLADNEGRKTYALDHVIYRVENMKALEYSVIDNAYSDTYPSDHLPVMAKFVCCTQ